MEQRKFHPVADVFPLLKGKEFDDLCESIKGKGLLNSITLHPDDGSIIDGRNRYRACLKVGVSPRYVTWDGKGSITEFAVALNVERRHLDARARALLGQQLEPLYASEAKEHQRLSAGRPKKGEKKVAQVKTREPQARELAAKAARTNPQYISDLKKIEKDAPEIYAQIKSGKIELPRAKRMLRQMQAEQRLKAAAKLARPDGVDLRVCTMEELLSKVRNLDAIISDPPDGADTVPLYGELARLAKKALKPDGILAVMCGLSYVPQIVEVMRRHISYRWIMAYMMVGGQSAQVWNRKVKTFWKPVVIFGEEPPQGRWLGDVVRSDMADEQLDGQQSESGFMRLVERLTVPDALVCDPFLGVGTTAVACVRLHRRILGCDTDKAAVEKARAGAALAASEMRRPSV
jgi:ParB-like chromosome segregation protein Spo0J